MVGAHVAVSSQRRIGSYQLINLIRTGHACEIWKVLRASEWHGLAMKLLRQGPHHSREQLGLLRHEYTVGQPLKHDRIVHIYDFASGADGSYLVMELCSSLNLKQRIQFGVERIAHLAETIIRQAAEGLQYLHEQGWVHCDVKPDNFLVTDEGNVKLIDFSLAQRPKGRLSRLFAGRARIQGTKSYMSPEQIRGKAVDPRSDIYSFGCLLHELLGGKVPFTGVSTNELLTKHLRSRPPLLESVNRNVTNDFSDLVARMLAKEPAGRPDSMRSLLDEMDRMPVFERRPTPPKEARPAEDRR